VKKCPKCKRFSDDGASTCDCGYSFQSGKVAPTVPAPRDRKGWVAANLWAALLGFFGFAVGGPNLPQSYWWAGIVAAVVFYVASDLISTQVRHTAFGLRSPGAAQLWLVLAYTVVVVPITIASFALLHR
jgi:hypothetical protein